ncbi:glycosyltransferase family 2 protein [Methylobacterium sp. PvR107]|uniref:glycosyltransferase family 2 protein n=1 Tax=Methylobacterium sp. PvR107 TaxID=2806597 RepID=UPI001AE2F7F9|nr:glycosyltransferase family 2 protein [Methylobacterium sp. PvR107]MBP1180330.1 GT2 family glycosyltransferase [Methylobacterium sp. PvR107]
MLPSDAAARLGDPLHPSSTLRTTAIRGRLWLGRERQFRLEPTDDPVFDRRLVLPDGATGWLVLSYGGDSAPGRLRPILRVQRGSGGVPQDFVLPGASPGIAHWLGLIPPDATELHLCAAPDFVLERVGSRRESAVLAQCLLRRPWRFVGALYERARGSERRYRDTLRGACAVTPMAQFPSWLAARARPARIPVSRLRIRCLILARPGEATALAATLDALHAQTHPAEALCVAWDGDGPETPDPRALHRRWDAGASAADLIAGADALCLLRPGDIPAPDALALLAQALPGADLAYGDAISTEGTPRLKPDWSPDLALATGYPGRPLILSHAFLVASAPRPVGLMVQASLALETAAAVAQARVAHIPRVLARTVDDLLDPPARARALASRLRSQGSPVCAALRDGAVRLDWPLPDPAPKVSVVIPSRDGLDLITQVCRGVLHETAYPSLELIIVDNGSTDPAVLAHYETLRADPRVRIRIDPQPFNFAAMVNAGVAEASGAVIVLLNNDVAVLEPGWLEAMVRQACRPEVGAVGAKLLYGDGSLQHAGVVVGLGGRAGHILRRRPGDTPGHLGRMRVAHEVSAVTAACLAVAREKYLAVGGFDAEAFAVDFNDVDFCLRLGAAGWKTVWTPDATLAHLESVSRGPSVGAKRARFEEEAARFSERWRAVIRHDPFYHPALSLTTFGEDLE